VKVLIADDHPLFLDAIIQVVTRTFEGASCCAALNFETASAMVHDDESFDLIVLDYFLPGVQGFSGLLELRRRTPTTPIVLVTAADDVELMRQAMQLGVSAYLPKSTAAVEMQRILRGVNEGESYFPPMETTNAPMTPARVTGESAEEIGATLTPRQPEVLRRLGEGKSNKEIARDMNISQETVKVHISAILRKLNVTSRTQAVVQAHRLLSIPAK